MTGEEPRKKRTFMRRYLPFWTLLLIILLSGGCRNKPEAGAAADHEVSSDREKYRIGLSFDSFVIERWTRDRDVFVSTAESLGAEVNVQNANGNVEEQIEQIRYFIKKKMDVIAVIAIDSGSLTDVINEARAAGIRVISYDRLILNAGTDLYISFDNRWVGELMGEALVKALPEGGKIFAIQGSESDNNVSQIREGLTKALEGTGVEIVYTAWCTNWLAELAFDHVNEALDEFGSVDGIMCGNDDLAGQAIRALAEHRLAGKVAVVAQDAELSACQRIMEGTQVMTVFKSVDEEAKAAALLAVALAAGEDITGPDSVLPVTGTINDGAFDVPAYCIEPVAVTAENMDREIIGSGFHRREDVYLNVGEPEEGES